MRGRLSPRGYTIVEVMVFLAISGFMFIIAATFVSGKQSRAEFKQGMNDINTQVQQVINDVSNGFYPSNSNFSCVANGFSGVSISSGSSTMQGANQGCVFMGKVIQFGINGSNGVNYGIYTVAGNQFANGTASGNPPSSFAEAMPKAIDNSAGGNVTNINLTQTNMLQWGLSATSMFDGATPISAVAFMGSFANQNGGSLESGSQTVNIVVIPSTATDPNVSAGGATEAQMVTAINNGITDINQRPHPNILMCFDGGKGEYGSLTIGGTNNSHRLSTSIQIYSDLASWHSAGC